MRLPGIAIEAAARLPETALHALASPRSDARQPVRRMDAHVRHGIAAYRFLDLLTNNLNLVWHAPGIDQQVYVLRHEDIGPQSEVELLACGINRVRQPLTRSLGFEEG